MTQQHSNQSAKYHKILDRNHQLFKPKLKPKQQQQLINQQHTNVKGYQQNDMQLTNINNVQSYKNSSRIYQKIVDSSRQDINNIGNTVLKTNININLNTVSKTNIANDYNQTYTSSTMAKLITNTNTNMGVGNMGNMGNVGNIGNTNNKIKQLHKDFGHIDHYLQYYKPEDDEDICTEDLYRMHRISNYQNQSAHKYEYEEDDKDKEKQKGNQQNRYKDEVAVNRQSNRSVDRPNIKQQDKSNSNRQKPTATHKQPNHKSPMHPHNLPQNSPHSSSHHSPHHSPQLPQYNPQQHIPQCQQQPTPNENQDIYTIQQQDYIQMIIQLDSQNSITLKVHIHDDPTLLAKRFCYTHNIDPKIIGTFAKQIKQLQYTTWNDNNSDNGNGNTNVSIGNNGDRDSRNRSKYNSSGSNKQSRIVYNKNNNNNNNTYNTYNNSIHSQVSIKSNTSNPNHNPYNNNIPKQYYQQQSSSQPHTNPTSKSATNTKLHSRIQYNRHNTNTNSKNNTTILTNINNTSDQNINMYHHISTNNNGNVFDRLYKNSQNKIKKYNVQRQKQKILHVQQQLRNYTTNDNKNNIINQSIYQNISNQNINTSNINGINGHQNNSLNNTNIQYINNNKNGIYQLKIYTKNVKLQKQTQIKNQYIKEQIQAQQEEQCTMHPEINPLSRLIVEKLRESNVRYQQGKQVNQSFNGLKSSHVRLYEQSKSKEKNISRTIDYLKEREERQLKECTFHPKILKKSQGQCINTSRHLLLHEDFYIRQNKAQTVKASQSKKIFQRHHPQINVISKRLTKGRSFTDRMVQYKVNAEKNKERIQKQRKSVEKYKPEINKNSKNGKQRNISIGEYLYSKSLEKKPISQSEANLKKPAPNKSSIEMYEEMKKNAFRYIFTLMDSDQDGLISALKINILGLETEILHLLAPLLCQMEDVKIQLDEQEFVESLQRLFNTFSILEKNMIINVYKNPLRKSKAIDEPSFHPSLNQKSIELAKQIREPGSSLYDIGREREAEKQYRLNQMRAFKALLEFQQCTFHPQLLHHH